MYLACTSESYGPLLDDGRLSLEDWFRLCAESLGLKAVEIEDRHIGEPTPARLRAVREAAEHHGLEIVNIAFMNNFGLADEGRRRAEEARTLRWIQASRELGSRFLRTFAGWPEGERDALWPGMLASLQIVASAAEQEGVRLVLENHNHGGFVQRAADVLAIFRAVASPALGLLLDSGNYLDGLASITGTAHLAWHVHAKFKQVQPDGRDVAIDQDGALAALRHAGYHGCVSVEYEGEEPGSSAVPRALQYLSGAIAR
jgi:sugar phosphate isomerase/epimerase